MEINKENLIEKFRNINDFSAPQKTFSPFYSNIGFEVLPEKCGSGAMYFHYNRASRKTWNNFFSFPLKQDKEYSSAFSADFGQKERIAGLTFTDTDTFLFAAYNLEKVDMLCDKDENLGEFRIENFTENHFEICGYSKNTDDRDPDEEVPFYIYAVSHCGKFELNGKSVTVFPNKAGIIVVSVSVEILDITKENAKKKANKIPYSFSEGERICENFYSECFEDFCLNVGSEKEEKLVAKAAYGLTANLAKAPGRLRNHISSFPSRGSYPTHFLWDTCFQNLAYEEISMPLAKDFLLQMADCQRADGKFAQFLCSTWERPHYSQPALVGWATMRIAVKCPEDREFITKMLTAIEKNNAWWLNARSSECGLISCPHGLETGQDDSPRFDNGTTFACDMNSYVLHQLCCAARLNSLLGNTERSKMWEEKANALSQKIVEILWCEEDGIFYDVMPESGEFVKIVSPVSFLPFWAGVKLPEEKIKASIEKYLINPEYLFGEIPFPSVAYNDKNYGSDKWWRGPTWMPNAYLMLETLGICRYENEKKEAEKRLYRVLINDGEMHELFDSKTGRGLGAAEQGWTNAIFIKLCKELNEG